MSIIRNTDIIAEVYTVEGGVEVRAEGMNEPAYFVDADVETVLDNEGDVWVLNPHNGRYYLPGEPYGESPEEADSTIEDIEEEYGLADINVPSPVTSEEPEPEAVTEPPAARFKRGDVARNVLSGREALILDAGTSPLGPIYTVIEKGFSYPAGCSATPGAATFPEFMLTPTEQPPFSEKETVLLTLVYGMTAV